MLVVTGVMKRAHKLESSSDIIFVDSTASCESSGSSLTILLTATKVGAVPIVALIHENQTALSYAKAFSLLKQEFPNCFGDKEVNYLNYLAKYEVADLSDDHIKHS